MIKKNTSTFNPFITNTQKINVGGASIFQGLNASLEEKKKKKKGAAMGSSFTPTQQSQTKYITGEKKIKKMDD